VAPPFEGGERLFMGALIKTEFTFFQEERKVSGRDALIFTEDPSGLIR